MPWIMENSLPLTGRRENAVCLKFDDDKLEKFQPLSVITKEWEDWFIKEYDIEICPIYLPPYNQTRTGCKGCPFSLHLQEELDMMDKYFPNERKQCELIWKPVYDEYRSLRYRLKNREVTVINNDKIQKFTFRQMDIFEFIA